MERSRSCHRLAIALATKLFIFVKHMKHHNSLHQTSVPASVELTSVPSTISNSSPSLKLSCVRSTASYYEKYSLNSLCIIIIVYLPLKGHSSLQSLKKQQTSISNTKKFNCVFTSNLLSFRTRKCRLSHLQIVLFACSTTFHTNSIKRKSNNLYLYRLNSFLTTTFVRPLRDDFLRSITNFSKSIYRNFSTINRLIVCLLASGGR